MSPRPLQLPSPAPRALGKLHALLLAVFHLAGPPSLAAAESLAADDGALLTLPVRFHITSGATMTVKDRKMDVWVKPADLTGPVIEEVNRIWKPAGIRFMVERAEVEPLRRPANFEELVEIIQNSKRGDEEQSGSRRTKTIAKLLDPAHRHPGALNVYLLPYIGSTYQGFQRIRPCMGFFPRNASLTIEERRFLILD